MAISTKKIQRELKREFPFIQLSPSGGGHIRILLPNGRSVFMAASPSCPHFMKHVRADIRRKLV